MHGRARLLACVIVAALVAGAGDSAAQPATRPPFIEDEIAGIRVGHDHSADVIRRFGRGVNVPGARSNVVERLCYWDPSRSLGLEFGTTEVDDVVAMVLVATMPEQFRIPCYLRRNTISGPIATGKLVRLGDSVQSVLKVYGAPLQQREDTERGEKRTYLEYEAPHERAPGVVRWYWTALIFIEDRLVMLLVIETNDSVTRRLRGP